MPEPTDITDQQVSFPDHGMTFERRKTDTAPLFWLGGVVALLIAGAGMALAIKTDVGMIQLQMMTTLPTLGALSCFITAWIGRNSPRRISVYKDGLTLEIRKSKKILTWDQIGWSHVDNAPLTHNTQLTLYAPDGKIISRVTSDFKDFDSLNQCLRDRISMKQDGVAERVEMKKKRKEGWLLVCIGPFLLLIALANIWMTWNDQRAADLLANQAVEGEARVLRHFVAPDGHTKRIEYEISTPEGLTGTHNAEVDPLIWVQYQGNETVPVVYVPSEPGISRLAQGELENTFIDTGPLTTYGLSLVMGLFGLVGIISGILFLRGIDIEQRIKDRFTKRPI